MPKVLATRPPTSTCAALPNSTPPGLTRNTCPFAVMRPWISEADVLSTRLSTTELALGCAKLTCALAPTLKLDQLRIALSLACLTVRLLPACEMTAEPAATCPPAGKAVGSSACAVSAWNATNTAATSRHGWNGTQYGAARLDARWVGPGLLGSFDTSGPAGV